MIIILVVVKFYDLALLYLYVDGNYKLLFKILFSSFDSKRIDEKN